jgi:hypothetical protein
MNLFLPNWQHFIRCLICVMSSGSVICKMWVGKVVTRAVHCPFQFIFLKYTWTVWGNQNQFWRSDMSNKNFERQHFLCCRPMESWGFKWGTEDKVPFVWTVHTGFLPNTVLTMPFFWKYWNVYGSKIFRKLNNLNTYVNLCGESHNGRYCCRH